MKKWNIAPTNPTREKRTNPKVINTKATSSARADISARAISRVRAVTSRVKAVTSLARVVTSARVAISSVPAVTSSAPVATSPVINSTTSSRRLPARQTRTQKATT